MQSNKIFKSTNRKEWLSSRSKKVWCFKPHFLELYNIPCGCFCSLIFIVSVDRTFDNTGAVWVSHWRKEREQQAASVHFMSMVSLDRFIDNFPINCWACPYTDRQSWSLSAGQSQMIGWWLYYLGLCLSGVRQAGYKFWLWTSYWWDLDKILGFSKPVFSAVTMWISLSSVQFSRSVMSDSLWSHELQHATPSCPSPTAGPYSNSCPLSWWCHPTISSSVIPFSSCPQSVPASGSLQMNQLFTSGGQSIGVSVSTSVLQMNTQDWSPLGWTGWIALQSKGLSRVFSNTTVQKHQLFGVQLSW